MYSFASSVSLISIALGEPHAQQAIALPPVSDQNRERRLVETGCSN